MLTQSEFMTIALSDSNYKVARELIKEEGLDFTVYSCNKKVMAEVIKKHKDYTEHGNKDDYDKICSYIYKANTQEKDIEILRLEEETKGNQEDGLDKFFKAFESSRTKERLFGIIGEAGVGKTFAIEKRFPNIAEYACNSALDPYSLCYYLADKDGTGLKPYETPFLDAIKTGKKVYLDEFNELPHDTKMFIQGITDEKKSVVIGDEEVNIHNDFKIMASFNPPSETDERDPVGDALLSRAVLYVMELTDEIIMERLKVSPKWLASVRRLYNHVHNAGLIDVRDLGFRDFDKFYNGYDFEQVFKGKMCVGDISNIREYKKIAQTGEYQELLQEIKMEMI